MSKESSREFLARMVRTKRQAELGREGRITENKRAAEPIVRELREAGFNVTWVGDLRHFVKDYSGAIPILVKWLPLVQNAAVKSDIVRTLSLPSQKGLAPLLLSEYRKAPSDNDNMETMDLRVAIANALEILADDLIFDDVADLAQDARAGASRLLFVLALGKMKNPRAVGILTSILDDPDVCAAAITSLGKLYALDAREKIAALIAASTPEVRAAAKKALAKIDKRRGRRP